MAINRGTKAGCNLSIFAENTDWHPIAEIVASLPYQFRLSRLVWIAAKQNGVRPLSE